MLRFCKGGVPSCRPTPRPLVARELAVFSPSCVVFDSLHRKNVFKAGDGSDGQGSGGAPDVEPLREIVRRAVFHGQLVTRIRNAIEEDGSVKANASDDVSRARGKRAAAEQRVRRALASVPGEVVWHMNRLAVQTTASGAASSAGALLVGTGRGTGATKLVEPRTAVELNNALEKASAELEAAETAVRRTLSLAAAALLGDLEIQLDIVATLDSIALRARHAAATNAAEPALLGPGEGAKVEALRHPLLIERIEGPFWEPSWKKASPLLSILCATHTLHHFPIQCNQIKSNPIKSNPIKSNH